MAQMKFGFAALALAMLIGCHEETSDAIQQQQQERILMEGTQSVGMPAIKNFRERRLLKDILELRDQSGLVTFTYVQNQMTGRLLFFCDSIGYGIPYATQFTSPSKISWNSNSGSHVLPQADPNGLFSPASADGTWVMCKDPNGTDVKPVYIEPRVVVSPFKLAASVLDPPVIEAKPPAAPIAIPSVKIEATPR